MGKATGCCELCGRGNVRLKKSNGKEACSSCQQIISMVRNHADLVQRSFQEFHGKNLMSSLASCGEGEQLSEVTRQRDQAYQIFLRQLELLEVGGTTPEAAPQLALDRMLGYIMALDAEQAQLDRIRTACGIKEDKENGVELILAAIGEAAQAVELVLAANGELQQELDTARLAIAAYKEQAEASGAARANGLELSAQRQKQREQLEAKLQTYKDTVVKQAELIEQLQGRIVELQNSHMIMQNDKDDLHQELLASQEQVRIIKGELANAGEVRAALPRAAEAVESFASATGELLEASGQAMVRIEQVNVYLGGAA